MLDALANFMTYGSPVLVFGLIGLITLGVLFCSVALLTEMMMVIYETYIEDVDL